MRQRKRVLAAVLSFLMLFGTDNSMNVYASEITGENLGSPMQSVEETETETQDETKTQKAAGVQEEPTKTAETVETEDAVREQTETEGVSEEQTGETENGCITGKQTGGNKTGRITEEQTGTTETEQVTGEQSTEEEQTEAVETQKAAEEQTEGTESQKAANVQKEAGLQISYLVLQKTALQPADSQFVLLGLDPGKAQVQDMTLHYRNRDTGADYQVQPTELTSDAAFFQMDHLEELTQGIYDLTGITYTTSDMSESGQTLALSDVGITASFGIGEEPADEPDAVITTEEEEQPEVVMTDATGNAISADGFAEALGKASADVASDAVDATGGSRKIVVVLDPGHGGHDGGASYYGRVEKNLNLSIATYCKAELETYGGVTVYMTRSDDTFVGLTDRTQIAANYGADIFVSIHNNACGNPGVSGASVYYPNGNYRPDLGNNGRGLAAQIENHLVSLGLANRGILIRNCQDYDPAYLYPDGSHADYYHVIRECKRRGIAGLIVEHAYMTSYSDMANHLASEAQLQQLGVADATAIAEYYGLTKGNNKITFGSVSSNSSTSVMLKWKENNYLDGYVIYRSTEKNGKYKKVKEIKDFAATSYIDRKLTSGKRYYYKIAGKKGTAETGMSGIKSGYAIAQPKIAAVTAAGSQVLSLSWKKVSGATGYEIYRSNSLNGKYRSVKKIKDAKTLSWKDKTVKTGKKYYYRLRAYRQQKDVTGYSSDSKKIYGSTIKATKLTSVTSTKSGHLFLKWSKITGAKKYQIYRSEKKTGKYRRIATTKNGKTTSYSDKSGVAGKTYYYKVRVINAVNRTEGYSDDSKPVSGRQLICPEWKSIAANGSAGISLSWKKVSGATGYMIYRSTAKNGSYKKLKTLKGTGVVKYTDKTGKKNQVYYYRIQASGKAGESAYSAKSWCRILNTPVLTNVLPQESGVMKLTWNKVEHAGGYILYRKKGTETDYKKIKTISGASVTSWQDVTEQGMDYQYQIQAYTVRNAGKADQKTDYSDRSNVITARHLEIPVLQLAEGSEHQAVLNWKKVSGVDGYKIFRSEEAGSLKTELDPAGISYHADTDSYTYDDTGVEAGHTYTYSIQSYRKQADQLAVSDLCQAQIVINGLTNDQTGGE